MLAENSVGIINATKLIMFILRINYRRVTLQSHGKQPRCSIICRQRQSRGIPHQRTDNRHPRCQVVRNVNHVTDDVTCRLRFRILFVSLVSWRQTETRIKVRTAELCCESDVNMSPWVMSSQLELSLVSPSAQKLNNRVLEPLQISK